MLKLVHSLLHHGTLLCADRNRKLLKDLLLYVFDLIWWHEEFDQGLACGVFAYFKVVLRILKTLLLHRCTSLGLAECRQGLCDCKVFHAVYLSDVIQVTWSKLDSLLFDLMHHSLDVCHALDVLHFF